MSAKDRISGKLFKLRSGNQDVIELEDGASAGSGPRFEPRDDQFYVVDPSDVTKKIRFDAGSVTTATTRVVTLPDADITLGSVGGRRAVYSADALDAAAVVTLTDAYSGAVIDLDMATVTVNLPALSSSNAGVQGIHFTFINSITATAQIIAAQSGDILHGGVTIMSTSAGAENDAFSSNGSSNLVLTMNGTTKGGIIGSRIDVYAVSATKWLIHGNLIGSGTLVTGFSDT